MISCSLDIETFFALFIAVRFAYVWPPIHSPLRRIRTYELPYHNVTWQYSTFSGRCRQSGGAQGYVSDSATSGTGASRGLLLEPAEKHPHLLGCLQVPAGFSDRNA